MPAVTPVPPQSGIETVTEILHGVPITDPYRWLEDGNSSRTQQWIAQQSRYARSYFDSIPGRDRIRKRIQELLSVDTYDSLQCAGNCFFFRKRLALQEQACIYMRQGENGEDRLLIDPGAQGKDRFTSVKLLRVSPDGRLVLYEVKEGGERTGTFALFDVKTETKLPDALPRGLLRGFVFAPDGKSFYYSHEPLKTEQPFHRAAYHHVLGTPFSNDQEIFSAGADKRIRLFILGDDRQIGIMVQKCFDRIYTDFYTMPLCSDSSPVLILGDADCVFEPILTDGRILALTDRDAPNLRVVELLTGTNGDPQFIEIVPTRGVRIDQWSIVRDRIFLAYTSYGKQEILEYDFRGRKMGELPVGEDQTVRLVGPIKSRELTFEAESFTESVGIWRYSSNCEAPKLWQRKTVPFDSHNYHHLRLWYTSKDGTPIPMFLLGRRDLLERGPQPVVMTAYGGFGASATPQFSIFVAFLVEHGCLFALPSIRGGGDFGADWHNQAKRRNRQTTYDDFLCAAEWLIKTRRAASGRLAIFGGSNSGLLVGAALTQRPDLFRAAVAIAPMMDMLRYHLFDQAHIWKDEFGTADDAEDFPALLRYSPYHRIREAQAYPATMLVSGDADTSCNPLHARKMTARLQAANSSPYPIVLDYSTFRGHSPVLPLSERIDALTDRMAFLSDQLQLAG